MCGKLQKKTELRRLGHTIHFTLGQECAEEVARAADFTPPPRPRPELCPTVPRE